MKGTEKSENSYYSAIGIDSCITHLIVAMEKVAAQHVFNKMLKM